MRARPAGWPARGNDQRAKPSRLADAPVENRNSLVVDLRIEPATGRGERTGKVGDMRSARPPRDV